KLVCKCFNVTDLTIIKTIRENNLSTLEDVTSFTKAGGACQSCLDEISEILERELKIRSGELPDTMPERKPLIEPMPKPAAPAASACAAPAGMSNLQRMQKVMAAMQMIRPQLQADGGDVELVDIREKTVLVRLTGHCAGCPASKATLKGVIEQILQMQVEPGIVVEEA
ncbi:MAG: NifU family protein, partial [Desulfovibrionaceae bacterium]|nr:NifU family protein [Desulfovibrionaceae bacterium]